MKLRSIQVLRAIAVSGVVVFHAASVTFNPVETWAALGAGGVDLFFVISGFIIATIARDRSPSRFFADRFWRIYPLWWFAVLPFLLILNPEWPNLAASLTLWPIYGGAFSPPALVVGWTLSFEMLFYAGVVLALRTSPSVPLLLFAIAFPLSLTSQNALAQFVGHPMILEFLMGVAIAKLPKRADIAAPALAIATIWLMLAPFSVMRLDFTVTANEVVWRVIAWGVPAALIVYAFLSWERHFASRWLQPAVVIGDASYSIYLFHILASKMLNLHWLAEAFAMVLTGVVVHLTLERRLMRMRREWRQSTRSEPEDSRFAGDGRSGETVDA